MSWSVLPMVFPLAFRYSSYSSFALLQFQEVIRQYRRLHLSARGHVRKKHVLNGCKHDMFCRQTLEVWRRRLLSTWFLFAQQNTLCKNFYTFRVISGGKCAVSEREIWLKFEKNEIWAECVNQKRINNLPLARQFALQVTADKLKAPVIYSNQA